MSQPPPAGSYFDKARSWAVTVMLIGGALAVTGSLLDWVVVTPPPVVPPDQVERTMPFTGIEARDGWFVIFAAAVLAVSGLLLYRRRRAGYAWLGFFSSMFIGAVGVATFRGIGELDSSITRRMDIVGEAEPAIGIMLVALAAVVGTIGSITGVAATPRSEPGA